MGRRAGKPSMVPTTRLAGAMSKIKPLSPRGYRHGNNSMTTARLVSSLMISTLVALLFIATAPTARAAMVCEAGFQPFALPNGGEACKGAPGSQMPFGGATPTGLYTYFGDEYVAINANGDTLRPDGTVVVDTNTDKS